MADRGGRRVGAQGGAAALQETRATALALTIVAGTLAVALPAIASVPQGTFEESVEVLRVHWPVVVEPIGCGPIRPDELEVTEDGTTVSVVQIGPRPLPRIHAVLIDTSSSMRRYLWPIRNAVQRHIEDLPAQDRVLVAGFDESTVLLSPATRDREQLIASLDELTIGLGTAVWDGIYDLLGYLAAQPEEKIVTILTDGEDRLSLDRFDGISRLARETPNLIVFPIQIGRPSTPPGILGGHALSQLARETGGHYLQHANFRHALAHLDEIRRRLDARQYVSYVPPTPDVDSATERWHEVRVRARKASDCRVRSLGSAQRFSGRRHDDGAELEQIDGRWRLAGQDAFARLNDDRQRLTIHAVDLTLERGPLFAAEDQRVRIDGNPVFSERTFAAATPPLGTTLDRRSPQDVMRFLLDEPTDVAPLLVNGSTFLEIRELYGRVVFDAYPEYRSWALARVETELDDRMRALGSDSASLRDAMRSQAADPRTGRPHMHLAGWLGDVSARQAALDLEGRAIERGEAWPIESWGKLVEWFGRATTARVVTPLVPAYDPERDQVGFFRFVLPRPSESESVSAPLPPYPMGLVTMRWLAEHDPSALGGGPPRIESIEYDRVKARRLRPRDCEAPVRRARGRLHRVALHLAAATVTGFFTDGQYDEPVCVILDGP